MSYWTDKPASAENLRLFVRNRGWVQYNDEVGEEGKIANHGCKQAVENAFLDGLSAANVSVLTGAGSSLSASNKETNKCAPTMAALWAAVKENVTELVFEEICAKFPKGSIGSNIERLLTLCKLHIELNGETIASEKDGDAPKSDVADFVEKAEREIASRVDFVSSMTALPSHISLVRKLGRRGLRKPRAKIFTTNYDLCFEEAARRLSFVAIDGFSHSLTQIYDRAYFDYDIVRRGSGSGSEVPNYIENVFQIYKLHGSIDWRRVGANLVRSMDPGKLPVLIYPRSSKYQESFEPPYLDMISAFQVALREPDATLIVSGFGFNDDHLSRPIMAAVESNLSLRLIVCDPVFIADEKLEVGEPEIAVDSTRGNQFHRLLTRLVEDGDPRIHLINGRFNDLAEALPDLVGETDRERHEARIKATRLAVK